MARTIPAMTDMKLTPAEKAETAAPPTVANQPDYPYGLRISLSEDELEKLGLSDEKDEMAVGDMIHLHGMAEITSISKRQTAGEECCRVELQITHLVAVENEAEEDEEAEESITSKLYSTGG